MTDSAPDDLRDTIDRFLVKVYEAQRSVAYAQPVALTTVAEALTISVALGEKVAVFLEREGLMDLDKEQVDLTAEGILRAESILRGTRPS